MTRTLQLLAGGFGACLAIAVAADFGRAASGAEVPPANPDQAAGSTAPDQATQTGLDALVNAIQERPLFAADRRPVAPPPEQQSAEAQPEVKTPPVLKGRLAGITLGPNDLRQAVFARPGEKPAVVKEGDDIDGWKVSTIEASRVVLTSTFGEKVMQPTVSVAGEGATPELPFQRRTPPPAPQQPAPIRPGQPGVPNFGNQAFPNPQMARPPAPIGRPLANPRRNQ